MFDRSSHKEVLELLDELVDHEPIVSGDDNIEQCIWCFESAYDKNSEVHHLDTCPYAKIRPLRAKLSKILYG